MTPVNSPAREGSPPSTAAPSGALDYRPEIDGLRAVAVLPILLFHLDFAPFSGGFVGVDVFFVISGYLITRIVKRDLEAGRFSFRGFYSRRIRRLFPALLATLALTLGAGYLVQIPASFARLASSTLYATFSLANVQFWWTSSYFDEASGLKPLLHTWSLSVEEQFYLLWPALLWLTIRRGRRLAPCAIALLSVATLVWAEITLISDASKAFFLMPFRIWEFGLGALLVWLPAGLQTRRAAREAALALGLAAIAWAVFTYDHETAFPGLAAVAPCAGAALCIMAGNPRTLGGLLRNRVAVGIGKLSYSIYLVH